VQPASPPSRVEQHQREPHSRSASSVLLLPRWFLINH